jgi:hypothetical protein
MKVKKNGKIDEQIRKRDFESERMEERCQVASAILSRTRALPAKNGHGRPATPFRKRMEGNGAIL